MAWLVRLVPLIASVVVSTFGIVTESWSLAVLVAPTWKVTAVPENNEIPLNELPFAIWFTLVRIA